MVTPEARMIGKCSGRTLNLGWGYCDSCKKYKALRIYIKSLVMVWKKLCYGKMETLRGEENARGWWKYNLARKGSDLRCCDVEQCRVVVLIWYYISGF